MAFPLALIPAAIGLAGSAVQYFSNNSKKKQAERAAQRALASQPDYQIPESAKNMLADTLASKNAVNPAIVMAYQQLQQQAANQQAQAQRSATSGAEALNVGSAAQNNLQAIVPQLMNEQTRYNQQNRGLHYNALQNMAGEDRNKQEWSRQKSNDMFNYYLGLAGAANQNKSQAMMGGLSSLMSAAGTMAGQNFNLQRPANANWQSIQPLTSIGMKPVNTTNPNSATYPYVFGKQNNYPYNWMFG